LFDLGALVATRLGGIALSGRVAVVELVEECLEGTPR
jgi:hypothetical protein